MSASNIFRIGMTPSPTAYLAVFAPEVREVLHVHIEQPWACFVDHLNHIRAGANCMPDVDAAADARIHILHRLQYIQRRTPQLVLGPVIVDRNTNVVLLYKLLNSLQSFRCGVSGDNHADTRSFAVFEFGPYIRIFVLGEINGPGGM